MSVNRTINHPSFNWFSRTRIMIDDETFVFNDIPGEDTNFCVKCERYQTFYSELQINMLFGSDWQSEDKFYTHIPCGHRYCEKCRGELCGNTSRDVVFCIECQKPLSKKLKQDWSEKTQEKLQSDKDRERRNDVLKKFYMSLSDFDNDERRYNDYLEKVEDIIYSTKGIDVSKMKEKLQEEINSSIQKDLYKKKNEQIRMNFDKEIQKRKDQEKWYETEMKYENFETDMKKKYLKDPQQMEKDLKKIEKKKRELIKVLEETRRNVGRDEVSGELLDKAEDDEEIEGGRSKSDSSYTITNNFLANLLKIKEYSEPPQVNTLSKPSEPPISILNKMQDENRNPFYRSYQSIINKKTWEETISDFDF